MNNKYYSNGSSQLLKGHTGPVRSVDFSNDSRFILTGSNDKTIKIFSIAERKFISAYNGHNNWVRCVRFSPDARLISSCSNDKSIKLWDVTKRNVIHTFIDHLEKVNTVRFSPDGTCLASGSVDKKIKLFDNRSGRLIQHYDAHAASVTSLSFHPSGKYLISSSMDSTMKIWDLINGQILYTIYGHEGPICSVSFSKCGDYFCSGGTDSILMIWKSNIMSNVNINEMTKSSKVVSRKIKTDSVPLKKKSEEETKSNKFPSTEVNTNNLPMNQQENPMKITMKSNASNNSLYQKLPQELTFTFQKVISQLDTVAKTLKMMDQRIQKVENQVTNIYNKQKKGIFKEYQEPPQKIGEEEYIMGEQQQEILQGNHQEVENEQRMDLQDTMKYYTKNLENNVFNQNLGEGIENNELEQIKQRNIPIEIFEDVGNHFEEFRNEQNEEIFQNLNDAIQFDEDEKEIDNKKDFFSPKLKEEMLIQNNNQEIN